MTFSETIDYLYARLPMFYRIGEAAYKADLHNTIALCQHLGNPERQFQSIHIAGTNGKGSSSHLLAAILQSAGYKTGLYTSPHLKSFRERIRLNGQEVPEDFVVQFVEENRNFTEALQPSFFELTVGMAFAYFAQSHVDVAVIETGLGGRLDSTNVILPEVSLITNISFDHQNILGNTLPKIAGEKAGIIKPGIPVVISERQPETDFVFEKKALDEGSALFFASDNYSISTNGFTPEGLRKVWIKDRNQQLEYELLLELKGDYQLKNLPGVLQTVEVLQKKGWHIQEIHLRQGLAETTRLTGLNGRWQVIGQSPLVICDVAHNEAGIREVVKQLEQVQFEQLYWVFGTVNDKDLSKILPLLPHTAYYFFCEPPLPRALKATVLAAEAQKYGLQGEVIEEVNAAFAQAKQRANPEDLILIAGSNFIVAALTIAPSPTL